MPDTSRPTIATTWGDPITVAQAGTLIYMAHLSIPAFLAVEQRHGRRFTGVEGLRANMG